MDLVLVWVQSAQYLGSQPNNPEGTDTGTDYIGFSTAEIPSRRYPE